MDLKEDNIFLANKYIPVLGDLGLADRIRDAHELGGIRGTNFFLDINGYLGKYTVDTDIFALGVMIYEIL